ncbi:MAG: VWA domain-containing protein [Candidatus Omnitrophica bacterium]|jgi:uncharacterized protein YegL|nr:VWA domain-containing protein [Candidatus Omnitrophota bacterium]
MPIFKDQSVEEVAKTQSGFHYSSVKMDLLSGSSEYTIVQILVDLSGSVGRFRSDLIDCLKMILESCKKHPCSDTVLLRVLGFSGGLGVKEIHGFLPINGIDSSIYDSLDTPNGTTPLRDAHQNALESLFQYGNDLVKNQFTVNSVLYILSDGGENDSKHSTEDSVKDYMAKLRDGDPLASFFSILVGFNDNQCRQELLEYQQNTTIDAYKSMGDCTPGKLAKLANFVSQSVSTASVGVGSANTSNQLSVAANSLTF